MTDYIRRDEALSFPFANGKYDHKNANEHFIYGCESYKEWLKGLPAADVRENVHANWILHEDDWYGDYWECSACHDEYIVNEGAMYYKHCPTCGAVMDGGDGL